MRVYHGILLVVVLTIGLIAAGVAWVRSCVAPLVEEAQQPPDVHSFLSADLPAECLEELSTMDQAKAVETAVARAAPGSPSTSVVARPQPANSPANQPATNQPATNQAAAHIEVAEDTPGLMPSVANALPIQKAKSAEYVEVATQSAAHPTGKPLAKAAAEKMKADDVLDVMRRLRSDEAEQRAEARRELVRRGFSEVDMELARQLFSPDAETRKQLARAVPRLASVDAAQWLMWLAQDPQPEVRLVAVSLLATTGDPGLLDRVEAMARIDKDAQIKALAEQIRKQRDLETARGDANPLR
jgi:hypothetical protein